MLQCWGLRPDERPSAKDLVTALTPQSDGTDSLHSQQSFNSQVIVHSGCTVIDAVLPGRVKIYAF